MKNPVAFATVTVGRVIWSARGGNYAPPFSPDSPLGFLPTSGDSLRPERLSRRIADSPAGPLDGDPGIGGQFRARGGSGRASGQPDHDIRILCVHSPGVR